MRPRVAFTAALVLRLARAVASTSTLRVATGRIKSGTSSHRSMQSRLEPLAAVAAEINAYLLILAIGLAALDFAVMVALNLPDPAVLSISSAGQDGMAPVAAPAAPRSP